VPAISPDEHGHLSAQIADLETRKRATAGEVIRRGVSECECAFVPQRPHRQGDGLHPRPGRHREGDGEVSVARFLKWSKRSAHVKTTARTGAAGSVREGGTMKRKITRRNILGAAGALAGGSALAPTSARAAVPSRAEPSFSLF